MVERALILSGGGLLDEQHFLLEPRAAATRPQAAPQPEGAKPPPALNQAVEDLEARLIDEALAKAEGNKAKAAALLDISERTLWYKLKKYRPDQPSS
jgi:two-component system response regulator AtoC